MSKIESDLASFSDAVEKIGERRRINFERGIEIITRVESEINLSNMALHISDLVNAHNQLYSRATTSGISEEEAESFEKKLRDLKAQLNSLMFPS